ncbi:MAG: outer membrane beta-barrel family protein [Prevotella sp.]|nr:outer membrane beta-barrel family protein [Prevotella sp.]
MKRFATLIIFYLGLVSFAQAQQFVIVGGPGNNTKNDTAKVDKNRIRLSGKVYDSFTKAALKAHVTLMRQDSTVVDTTTCWMWTWGTSDSYYEFRVPRKPEHFIIKAECEGYHPGFINYNMRYIARNHEFEMPRILLKKKAEEDDIFGEGSLDGVVVTGTKVKIAYRGDTVVYNASAFNLPEGSMLDGLVREMPGAELKDNGDIYVNGKKVDFLTLNGKDFFKGNNKVMLDNLPYYTVQTVEVYDKSSEESQWKGQETTKKDFVMDVKLKREYNRGLLANIEGGVGTDDRYLSRFFALYYTDHTRLSLFGNLNNVNEDRRPGQDGNWSPANQPQGLRSTKQVGLNLTTEDQDKNVEERFDATLTWNNADNQTRTSSERFGSEGSVFSGSESLSKQKDFRFSINNHLTLNVPIKLRFGTRLDYSNGDLTSESSDSTWQAASLTNRTHNLGLNNYRSVNLNSDLYWFKKLPWGDGISLWATIGYNQNKPSESFSQNLTEYMQTGVSDFRNRYTDSHSNNYNFSFNGEYTISLLNGWRISPNFSYHQSYRSYHNMSYRLDRLNSMNNGISEENEESLSKPQLKVKNALLPSLSTPLSPLSSQNTPTPPIGWLPSNAELFSVLDTDNSDTHTHFERTYQGRLNFSKSLGDDDGWIDFGLPLQKIDERMHYDDGVLDTIARRSDVMFQPSFSYYKWGKNSKMLSYNMSVQRPDYASLMPTDDTTNPLIYTINNPNLKNTTTHSLFSQFSFRNDSTARIIYLTGNVTLTQNATGTRSTYNSTTGFSTYMQDNVNGNWVASATIGYERPLGKARLFSIENNIGAGYTHSVDFDMLTYSSSSKSIEEIARMESPLSKVNTTNISEKLRLKYQKNKLTLQVGGDVSWRHSKGTSDNFQTINAWDFSYGLTAKYTIPFVNIDFGSDLNMFSRRGYNSSMMNTDDLVWNASLSRTFLKGKLTARLMAFDILHQLSSTQYNVNAQGRTETWHNCIPRYALLTLAYKFQKMPKGKKSSTSPF